MIDAALSPKREVEPGAVDLDVPAPQGGEAERAVLAGVLVVSDADQRLVEQSHDGRQDLTPAEVVRAQVALHALAHVGQDLAELEHPPELRLVPRLAIARVIAVLLPPARVASGDLDVAARIGADPDLAPGRGNDESLDARALRSVLDPRSVGREEDPASAHALPANARNAVGDVAESGPRRRFAMLLDAQRKHRPGCSTALSPVLFFELHPRLLRDPRDVRHRVRVAAGEDHRPRGIDALLHHLQRPGAGKRGRRRHRRFLRGKAEHLAQEVVGAAGAEVGVGEIARGGPAHRRHVDEVEALRALDVEQLAMVRELLESPIRVQEGEARFRLLPAARIAVELLDHRRERRKAGPGPHHQNVLEAHRTLGEREVADDPLDIREAIVVVRLDSAEERLGEPTQHAVLPLLEHHVELEIVPLFRLERRGGDRVRMCHRAALLPALIVEVGDVADLVSVLHLPRQQAIVAAKRDVLPRLVGRKPRAVARDEPEERQARREPVPFDDLTRLELCHGVFLGVTGVADDRRTPARPPARASSLPRARSRACPAAGWREHCRERRTRQPR